MDSYFVVDQNLAAKPATSPAKRVVDGKDERSQRVSLAAGAKASAGRGTIAASARTRSSEEGRREDALASGAEEGRDKLRKATVSRK